MAEEAETAALDTRLLACDHDPDITQRATADWAAAGVADRIDLSVLPIGDGLTLARKR